MLSVILFAVLSLVGSQKPVYGQGAEREYPENGTSPIVAFMVQDEEGTAVAWSLTGVDGGDFTVDDGVVSFRRSPDHEDPSDSDLDNHYEFSVNVSDGVNTTSARMTVMVTNVDEDGVVAISSLQPQVGVPIVATLADPDGEVSDVTWLWDFSTDGETEWTTITGADSESYTPTGGDIDRHLRATASYTDGEGVGKSASSTSIYAVRESHPQGHRPEFPESETGARSLPENTEPGTNVGSPVSAVDEEGHVLTYTLNGLDAVSFDLVRSSGQLVTRSHLDHETRDSYSMMLTVSDPTGSHNSMAVTVTVTNVEEEGTVTLSTPQPHVDEELRAYLDDPDGGVTDISWQWERSQDRADWITIGGAGSETYTPTGEDEGSHLRVTASYTDGEGPGKSAHAVTLNPVHELETNHAPTFLPTETGVRRVAENTPPGSPIGEPFTAIDDHDHVLTYSLEGEDADSFAIATTTGQLLTREPLDHERKSLYSIVVTVHDGEDAHGDPDHSSDVTLSGVVVVTDVDEGLAPGVCVDGGAVENYEDNVLLVAECEVLLSMRDELTGGAMLNWSEGVPMSEWDGVSHGGVPARVTELVLDGRSLSGTIPSDIGLLTGMEELDLSENLLTGGIPSEVRSLTRLRDLRLSDNALTGPIPPELESLTDLHTLQLSGNAFSGCVPGALRQVESNDLIEMDLPHCDVLLGYLEIFPGELNQQFDPYRTNYTAMSLSSRITAGAVSEAGTARHFLDNLSRPQPDADTETPGHQVDTGPGVTFTRVRVVSADREAERTYTVLVAAGGLFLRYDADGNRVIDRDEILLGVRDYFDGLIGRDEVIGLVQLYFFHD